MTPRFDGATSGLGFSTTPTTSVTAPSSRAGRDDRRSWRSAPAALPRCTACCRRRPSPRRRPSASARRACRPSGRREAGPRRARRRRSRGRTRPHGRGRAAAAGGRRPVRRSAARDDSSGSRLLPFSRIVVSSSNADVEIVDQRGFAAAGHEDHLLDPRLARLVDRILDQRPVDDRQQLLRDGLGGGQQAGAEAGDREHGLAKLLRHSGSAGPVSLVDGLLPGADRERRRAAVGGRKVERSTGRGWERLISSSTRSGSA